MGLPGRPIGEMLGLMLGQLADDWAGERAALHVGERLGIDHVIAAASAQQVQEIEPALRAGRAEPSKAVIADVRAGAVLRLVAGVGVVDRDPGSIGEAGAEHVLRFGPEATLAVDQEPYYLTLQHGDAHRI